MKLWFDIASVLKCSCSPFIHSWTPVYESRQQIEWSQGSALPSYSVENILLLIKCDFSIICDVNYALNRSIKIIKIILPFLPALHGVHICLFLFAQQDSNECLTHLYFQISFQTRENLYDKHYGPQQWISVFWLLLFEIKFSLIWKRTHVKLNFWLQCISTSRTIYLHKMVILDVLFVFIEHINQFTVLDNMHRAKITNFSFKIHLNKVLSK